MDIDYVGKIVTYDDIFSSDKHSKIWNYVRRMNYRLDGISSSDEYNIRYKESSNFLYGDLNDAEIKDDIIKHSLFANFEISRVYANGHFVDGGLPHKDDLKKGSFTFIYYPHLEWEYYWGGETLFFDDYSNLVRCVIPKPNSAVIFDSRIIHFARSASSYANIDSGFRITIAVKMKTR